MIQSDNIVDIVLRVEELYGFIDQEFSKAPSDEIALDDNKIEAWSKEIEKLCEIVDTLPVNDIEDLKAKILLNLSLISKSFLDSRSIEIHSDKIIEAIDDFGTARTSPGLRIVG